VRQILIRWAILAIAIAVAAIFVDGFDIHGGFFGYVGVAAVLGLVNALIRPIARLLTLPLTIMTLGLFSIIVNAFMLVISAWLSSVLSIESFWQAILASIIISIVSTILNFVVREPARRRR
jgi:putative membrane protein